MMSGLQRCIQSLDEIYAVAESFGCYQPIENRQAFLCCQRSIIQRYIWELLFYDQVTFSFKGEYGQFLSMDQAGEITEQLHDLIVATLRDVISIDARYIEEIRFLNNDVFVLHREPEEGEDDDYGVLSYGSQHELLGYC